MPVLTIFPTPIYARTIVEPYFSAVQAELKKTYVALQQNGAFGDPWDNGRILVSNKGFDERLLLMHGCTTFLKCLDNHIRSYLTDIGVNNPKYRVATSWMTPSLKHSYAHAHEHSPFDISGVYYYQTNGSDGNLFFKNPTHLPRNLILFQSPNILVETR